MIVGVAMVKTAFDMYPEEFRWKQPPYEYVFDRNPFDVIAGTNKMRESFERGESLDDIQRSWQAPLADFKVLRDKFLLYS